MAIRTGTPRDDTLRGTGAADTLDGLAGNDRLFGRGGGDQLLGRQGLDELFGESGDDLLVGGLGDDLMDGGSGRDTASYEGNTAAVDVDLRARTAISATTGTDTLIAVENVRGTNLDDIIAGSDGANIIEGLVGDDEWLEGWGGDDTIYGGEGNDNIVGDNGIGFGREGAGPSSSGGRGDDRLYGGNGSDGIHGQSGDDLIWGDAGNDFLSGGGSDPDGDTEIGSGNDTIYGGTGNDRLQGWDGDDRLDGGAGADRLSPGLDDDRMTGGTGNDLFSYVIFRDSLLLGFGFEDRGRDLVLDFKRGEDQLSVGLFNFDVSSRNLDLLDSDGNRVVDGRDEFADQVTVEGKRSLVLDIGSAMGDASPEAAGLGLGTPGVDTLTLLGVTTLDGADFA